MSIEKCMETGAGSKMENRTKTIEPIDIIIPTFNNWDQLGPCISSIIAAHIAYPVRIIIVNNGHPDSLSMVPVHSMVEVVQTGGRNLGWEGGLKEGLKRSKSEFVCFMNDDTYVPQSSMFWLHNIMHYFRNPEVGAVGPTSNVVMGTQNIWKQVSSPCVEVSMLIGFCVVVRRSALDAVGGVDDTLPGGDDLDLSIRLTSGGYKLLCCRNVFIYHHGFSTGNRLHGDSSKRNGWNSQEMTDRTNTAIIKKHGFKKWYQCIAGMEYTFKVKGDDIEGEYVRGKIIGDKILDLGCANNKTVPNAIGVDVVCNGVGIPNLHAQSECDVQADATKDMPFDIGSQDTIIARHLLEHCIDPIEVLNHWSKYLKPGGRLIVAVPDEDQQPAINLNPEHVHAFTLEFLLKCGRLIGLKDVESSKIGSGSVVAVFEKGGNK